MCDGGRAGNENSNLEGVNAVTMEEVEFAIVGSGPAGLMAAVEAANNGVEVVLFDEHAQPGGQLFKQIHKFFGSEEHYAGKRGIDIGNLLLEQTRKYGVTVRLNTIVWGLFEDNMLGILNGEQAGSVKAKKILLATGASENPLAFPGWTLPGVMGAGAVQTLINLHRVLPGKRCLMVGSGNVGLIVAYHILQAGGEMVRLVEAASNITGWGVHASKLVRCGVPIEVSKTVKAAYGGNRVESVELVSLDENWRYIAGTEEKIGVDLICIATGLTPLTELAWIAGCRHCYVSELGGWVPLCNENFETTVPGIYAAGDITGIDEAATAMEEGRIAGVSVAEVLGYLSRQEAKSNRERAFSRIREFHTSPWGIGVDKGREEVLKSYS
jgi:thioredoxin reductase